jgi:hypothetical protein
MAKKPIKEEDTSFKKIFDTLVILIYQKVLLMVSISTTQSNIED